LVRFGARDYDPETGRWTGISENMVIEKIGSHVNHTDKENAGLIPG
jgi:hypothetical protein